MVNIFKGQKFEKVENIKMLLNISIGGSKSLKREKF